MDASVIRNEKINKHNVETYHFKVLSSSTPTEEGFVSQSLAQKFEEIKPELKAQNEQEDIQNISHEENKTPTTTPKKEQENPPQDSFVEKLLKKTDELSTNIIKLQMQIENQEAEFEKRLEEEILRAQEEGQRIGEQTAQTKYQEALQSLQTQYFRSISLLEEECKNLNEFTQKNEEELSNVAIQIAKEVIAKEVEDHSSQIAKNLAASLLKDLQSDIQKQIKVNPKDYEELKNTFQSDELVQIKQDEAISQGGLIILSDSGNIEATISKRLEKFIQMMDE